MRLRRRPFEILAGLPPAFPEVLGGRARDHLPLAKRDSIFSRKGFRTRGHRE